MAVANPFFIVKLSPQEYAGILSKTGDDGKSVAAARRDPMIEFRDADNTVLVGHDYRTMVSQHTPFRRFIKMPSLTDAMKNATDTFKSLISQRIDDARDQCRTVFDPPAFVEPPQPALDPNATGKDAGAAVLKTSPGIAIGRKHGDAKSAEFLIELMNDDSKPVDMLFIEEFRIDAQQELDDYLNGPLDAPMGPKLKQRVSELKGSYNVDWEPILFKAKQKKVKLYGIDTNEAEPGVESSDPRYGERRVAVMNTIAADVVKKARTANPTGKFVLMCGDAHLNTHPGGVPGLSQMLGVPGLHVNPKGQLRNAPDDKTQRGMPKVAEQKFIDEAMAAAVAKYNEIPADKRAPSILKDEEARRVMQKLARKFVDEGKLNAPGDVAALLTHKNTTKAIKDLCERTKGRDARRPLLEKAVTDGKLAAVKKLLAEDPDLAIQPGAKDRTLLHLAAQGGHDDIVYLLLKAGANPNGLDEEGTSPLHEATKSAAGGKDVALTAQTLLDAGADPTLPDGNCKSGYDLAVARGDTEAMETFLEAGAGKIKDLFVKIFEAKARNEYEDSGRDAKKHEDFDAGQLRKLAGARFEALAKATRMANAQDVRMVLNVDDDSESAIEKLIKVTKARKQRRTDMRDAIAADKTDDVVAIMDADPLFTTLELENNQTVLTTAALKGKDAMMLEILKKGADPNHVSSRGRTTLHEVCGHEVPKTDTVAQEKLAETAGILADLGADVNVRNRGGQTPLHLAGFRNNVSMVKTLADAGADARIKDNRGWTAYDSTLGSTNKEAEAAFHEKGLATKQAPVAPGQHSTVDLLCMATLCNDPTQDELKVRKMYEKLYAEESLRPVLDLAAAASCNDRNPPSGGLRIFANNSNTVGPLFGATVGPSGAYDEKVNTLLMPTATDSKEKEASGTVIHELTHMTAHLVTEDEDALPFVDDGQKQMYLKAIEEDVKRLHQLSDNDEAHKFVKNRIGGRMTTDGYASKKGAETDFTGADKRLLQEFVVGVPQLIASYGSDYVRKHAPNLMTYFEELGRQATQVVATDPRFANGRAAIDPAKNTALASKLKAENVAPKPPRVALLAKDKDDFDVDNIIGKLRAEYVAQYGRQKPPKPGERTVACSADDFEMDPKDKASVEKKLASLKKVLKTTLAQGQLPPKLSSEALKPMLVNLCKAVHDAPNDKELTKAATKTSDTWAKKAKIDYVQTRIEGKHDLTSQELAEAIVLEAELRARGANPEDDSWVDAALDTKQTKQKAAIKELAAELDKPAQKARRDDPKELIRSLSAALADKNRQAIYVKTEPKRTGKRDTSHVSINTANVKRIWLQELNKVPVGDRV